MSLINITNLTFCYDGSFDNIFENVSFKIDTNWKLGFCGRNGRGKTTFLNLLLGKYEYKGGITSSVNFEYFPYHVVDKSQDTIDIINGIGGDFQEWQLLRELGKLSVEEDVLHRPFETLSNGEQTKVLIAALFLKENSFLLIDEPTNHLDLAARDLIAGYLKSKSGFILVSHDRTFLDTCIDHILSINKTNIEIQQGNFSSWYYNKLLQDNYEITQNDKLKKEISRLTKTAREKVKWSDKAESKKIGIDPRKVDNKMGHRPLQAAKSKKMMSRAKAIEGRLTSAIEGKEKLLKNIEQADILKIKPLIFHSKRLIECKDISLFYGEKEVCKNISFTIEQGDRIALRGKNGCGKSSIIKLICGENIGFTGDFYEAKGLKISYVSQDATHLNGTLMDYEKENNLDISLFRAMLRKLDFSRDQFDKRIDNFSAGQKKKVLIAHSLCEQAHLYIWDEPLNYIDVLSRIQIENLIKEYNPTLLFVEHDKTFCENIATKLMNL